MRVFRFISLGLFLLFVALSIPCIIAIADPKQGADLIISLGIDNPYLALMACIAVGFPFGVISVICFVKYAQQNGYKSKVKSTYSKNNQVQKTSSTHKYSSQTIRTRIYKYVEGIGPIIGSRHYVDFNAVAVFTNRNGKDIYAEIYFKIRVVLKDSEKRAIEKTLIPLE